MTTDNTQKAPAEPELEQNNLEKGKKLTHMEIAKRTFGLGEKFGGKNASEATTIIENRTPSNLLKVLSRIYLGKDNLVLHMPEISEESAKSTVMDDEAKRHWLQKDSWDDLLVVFFMSFGKHFCFYDKNGAHYPLHKGRAALAELRRAVAMQKLKATLTYDETGSEVRLYSPEDVVKWVTDKPGMCPNFPFSMDDLKLVPQLGSKDTPSGAVAGGTPPIKWPWGDYTTKKLEIVAQAVQEFWVNYYSDDHTTTVKNERVKEWLISKGMGGRVAESIAQIIRPDGLAAGRPSNVPQSGAKETPSGAVAGGTPSIKWPWGDYSTKKLEIVAEAVQKFWVNYDPNDRTTAEKNKRVENWLISKGMSERLAESIAQIIRADGLPAGRPPK
ncbi:MAG: hypothetical protein LBQ75_02200 [Zoogloeaceae bacterium]|jgi:predicted GNAT family acetyltransferase|nr:hypothetical protein [Zoogloeaceae bacterium]